MPGWMRRNRGGQNSPEQLEPRLTNLLPGQEAEVSGVDAGRKARYRLASLGLIPGSRLRVVASARFGPMLLSLGETRLMVERGVAAKVMVRRVA